VRNLELLFNPRGIAVIGASPDFGRPGGQTMQVLTERGYQGGIYPVNPKYDAIAGRPCFPSIESVPQPCDVAVIALPAAQVPPSEKSPAFVPAFTILAMLSASVPVLVPITCFTPM